MTSRTRIGVNSVADRDNMCRHEPLRHRPNDKGGVDRLAWKKLLGTGHALHAVVILPMLADYFGKPITAVFFPLHATSIGGMLRLVDKSCSSYSSGTSQSGSPPLCKVQVIRSNGVSTCC